MSYQSPKNVLNFFFNKIKYFWNRLLQTQKLTVVGLPVFLNKYFALECSILGPNIQFSCAVNSHICTFVSELISAANLTVCTQIWAASAHIYPAIQCAKLLLSNVHTKLFHTHNLLDVCILCKIHSYRRNLEPLTN